MIPTYGTYNAEVNFRSRTSVVLGDVFNEIYKSRGFPDNSRHSTASPQAEKYSTALPRIPQAIHDIFKMLLIKICALLPAVSALPSQVFSKRGPNHKVQIPYSVNCTSNPKEVLLQTTPKHFSTVQSAHWPLLIGLKKSPVELCGHNNWLILNSIVSANASNSSFTTSSTFYDSDQALTTYLTSLSNATNANSTHRSLERRWVEAILGDLAADSTDWECPPCEFVTAAKTIVDIGSFFGSTTNVQPLQIGLLRPPHPNDDDPPPAQPSTCTVNPDETPLKMEPPDTPDNDDGPCKVSCEDCRVSFGSDDQANGDASFQHIDVDEVKYTGTVLFQCSGAGDKDYKLQLVKAANSIGGGVNIKECDVSDVSIGHEIDFDASLTGSYHIEGSGSFQFDFEIDSAAFQAQGTNTPSSPAVTAEVDNISGKLEGSYKLSAEIEGSIKDITTLNGAMLAGYGISAKADIEISGAGNATAASSEDDVTASISRGDAPQTTACMDTPTVDASGKLWFSVYAAGSDAVDFDLWSGDMTVEEGDSFCS